MRRTLGPILLCCVVLIAGMAAASGAEADRIYGCRADKGGALRIVGASTSCRDGESRLFWNVQGPRGYRGYRGYKGDTGDRGPRGYQGLQGEVGPTGPTGPRGPRGYQGLPGEDGAPGIASSQSCAAGSFVKGIASNGTLTCAVPSPSPSPSPTPTAPPTDPVDVDQDGFDTTTDCNDNDAAVHPDASEVANGVDDDCDSLVDEGLGVALESVSLAQSIVRVPREPTGQVTISGAVADDTLVALSSSDPSVATVPASVLVPAGQSSAPITVTTIDPGDVTITATLNGGDKTTPLKVLAADTPSTLIDLVTEPEITYPTNATVTLNYPAPEGGVQVNLSSSNPSVIEVNPYVTVAADATSATFMLNVQGFGSSTITASYGGIELSDNVTVVLDG